MKILSIQVGLPKTVTFNGKQVTTGIFKNPVKGPVQVNTTNIVGDGQADLNVHGGRDKAVYGFSYDAYDWWQKMRPKDQFDFGAFGENLTIDKISENNTYIGDTFEIGGAVLQVSQPRLPCFKLGIKFNDHTILKTFIDSNRPGVYFRVLREGLIDKGDNFKLIDRDNILLSVTELFNMTFGANFEKKRAKELLKIKGLPANYRKKLLQVLA